MIGDTPVGGRIKRRLLPLRLWWRGIGYEKASPGGNDQWLARQPIAGQLPFLFRFTTRASITDWTKQNVFKGHSEYDAFEIVSDDDSARNFLEGELFARGYSRPLMFNFGLREILEGLVGQAASGQDAFAEIQFEKKEGQTQLKRLTWIRAEAVERHLRTYTIDPAKRFADATSEAPPYEVADWLMIDVRRDLPILSTRAQELLIADYFEEQLAQYDVLNNLRLQAEPELRGLRWDAVRIRRGSSMQTTYLCSARTSVTLGQSLIHRCMFHRDQPPFTRYFLLWHHLETLNRLRQLRGAIMDIVNERIVRVLVEANGMGTARLIARQYRSAEEEYLLFQEALRSESRPTEFYMATLSPERAGQGTEAETS